MKEYKIIPKIAALVDVECELFPLKFGHKRCSFIYLSTGKPPEKGCGDSIAWSDLPTAVQEQIDAHFAVVFTIPIEKRGEYLSELKPWAVEA